MSVAFTYHRFSDPVSHDADPFDLLSTELLSLIFVHCISGELDNDLLWLLELVCSRWRNVVLSTPQLWTFIDAEFTTNRHPNHDGRIHKFVERSGNCPLFVRISLFGIDQSKSSAFQALLQTSHRWQTLTLSLPFSDRLALVPLRHQVPKLQEAHIKVIEDGHSVNHLSFDVMEDAPALRDLHMEWFIPYPWVSLPWSQLTRFSGIYHSLDQTLLLLSQLTHVEELEIRGWNRTVPRWHLAAYRNIEVPTGAFVFPSLHTLAFRESVIPDPNNHAVMPHIAQALGAMNAPALKKAIIHRAATNQLSHLIHRSGCDLNSLGLEGGLFPEGSLTQLLQLTPNLCELSLGVGTLEELSSLYKDGAESQEKIVPHMRYLTINRMDARQNPGPTLLELKKSRMVEVSGGSSPGKELELIKVLQTSSYGLSRPGGGWADWIGTIVFFTLFLACAFPSSFLTFLSKLIETALLFPLFFYLFNSVRLENSTSSLP